MDKHRSYPLLMMLLVALLIIGIVVLFWGASTYVRPRTPFGGPPMILRNVLVWRHMIW